MGEHETEVTEALVAWNGMLALQIETLGWAEGFINRHRRDPIRFISPAEFQELHEKARRVPAGLPGMGGRPSVNPGLLTGTAGVHQRRAAPGAANRCGPDSPS